MDDSIGQGYMKIPDWVENILSSFERRTDPYMEVEIADSLRAALKGQGKLNDEDLKGFIVEWSAFLFFESRNKESVWGTYFAPMMSAKKEDGTALFSPDIKDLDDGTVAHWEERARTCANPVMRARTPTLFGT
jgi:hypothetical protein